MSAVVGLDLSLTATGIATPRGLTTIKSTGHRDATLDDRHERLVNLRLRVYVVIAPAAPGLIVIEAPAYGSRSGHNHDRSGLWWGVVSELRGRGIPVAEVPPTVLKRYACGKGNAGKDEVLAAVIRRYPDVDVTNNNEADALVLRAMGCDWLGSPLAEVPKANRAALDKVVWPEAVTA